MKILVISNLYPPYYLGGYELLCSQVVSDLKRRGHIVTVLTSDHGCNEKTENAYEENIHRNLKLYVPFGQDARAMRIRKWSTGRYNQAVTEDLLDKIKPDLIFIWSQLRLTLNPAQVAEKSGLPVLYSFNDNHILGYSPANSKESIRGKARFAVDRWLLNGITNQSLSFSNSTCISRVLKQSLINSGIPITNSKVIYQGIPVEKFTAKDTLGIINEPLKLLYVGQLHSYKGVHTAIEAVHKLAQNKLFTDTVLTIVGDGSPDYCQQLKQTAAAGSANIKFSGKVPHNKLADIYRANHILLFPSLWQEPFGLTHLEAMACGTNVISTNNGGQGEFLENEINSLVFDKGDVDHLTQQIYRLATNNKLAMKLASNAIQMVTEYFSVKRYVDDLEEWLGSSLREAA